MRRFQFERGLVVLLTFLAVAFTATVATAQDDDGMEKRVRVEIRTAGDHQCEGDDCEHAVRTWVSEDGQKSGSSKVFVIGGEDGKNFSHGDADGAKVFVKRMGGGHGGEHVWISRDGEVTELLSGGGYLGVQLTDLTDALRSHFGVSGDAGVMISEVVKGSPAELAGFRAGDIITALDGSEVGNGAALSRQVRKLEEGENAGFEVVRDSRQMTINATIAKRESTRMAKLFESGQKLHFGEGRNMLFGSCDDDEEDCSTEIIIKKVMGAHSGDSLLEFKTLDLHSLDCGDAENCEVLVTCDDGSCTCTVDGADVECQNIGQE